MARLKFTDSAIRALPPAQGANRIDYADGDVRGFAIQTTYTGAKRFLLVYVAKESGRERRMVLGEFGPAPRLSVSAARRIAAEKRALVDLGRDPWLEAKNARALAEAEDKREAATLAALLAAYVEHLKAAAKPSWKEVQGAIDCNLLRPFPRIADLPCDRVDPDVVMPVFRRLARAGKWRAAEKLAIYMRAAYNAAKAARTDAAGIAFEAFEVRTNPLQDLKVTRPETAGRDAVAGAPDCLSADELQAYWREIGKAETKYGPLMIFHLLTGGQRMEQLSRLTVADWDEGAATVTLFDTKGRRRKARRHVIPLVPQAEQAVQDMRTGAPKGPYLFSVSAGEHAAVPHTLAAGMRRVSEILQARGEVSQSITPGVIRRTVETRLAALKVSKEVRAQLQSHGLGGIQDRHYDRHSYMDEKRHALDLLLSLVTGSSNVVLLTARRA